MSICAYCSKFAEICCEPLLRAPQRSIHWDGNSVAPDPLGES